jgi:hypothetical protein
MAQSTIGPNNNDKDCMGSAGASFRRGADLSIEFTLPTSAANAIVFPFAGYSGGRLIFISADAAGTVAWYETHDPAVAVYKSHDKDGAAITQALTNIDALNAAAGIEIPPELFGCGWIAPIGSTGTITCRLLLKK